jgi:hypothetical protein
MSKKNHKDKSKPTKNKIDSFTKFYKKLNLKIVH